MDPLLAKLMQGLDPDDPELFFKLLLRVFALMPWAALFWWSVLFIAVGALLGWWRRRLLEGIAWALLLGPLGWLVILLRRSRPPPLPSRRRSGGV